MNPGMSRKVLKLGLATLLVAGCSPISRRDAQLEVWRAPESSLAQRTQAVASLIPKGASPEAAEKLLGTPTRRARRHGPTLNTKREGAFVSEAQADTLDEWLLEYEFRDGGVVCLHFEIPPSNARLKEWPFVGASSFRTNEIKAVPFTQ